MGGRGRGWERTVGQVWEGGDEFAVGKQDCFLFGHERRWGWGYPRRWKAARTSFLFHLHHFIAQWPWQYLSESQCRHL